VHARAVVACSRVASEKGVNREVRSFGTDTAGLLALRE
jgi:hypothetical protein